MIFYLGTHMPAWLWNQTIPDGVPLFVSRRRLVVRVKRPWLPARMPWCMDSGGFTELSKFGRWTITARQYAAEVQHYSDSLGSMVWAAPMDHMCEPWILKKTKRTLQQHQLDTVTNFLELRELKPHLPFIPVLQGWRLDDYLRCWDLYDQHGVDLEACHTVGLGSVCRRQGMAEAADIVRALQPLQLHGFGFKLDGIRKVGHLLKSADSMAWSFDARMAGNGNCPASAIAWRNKVVALEKSQPTLADLFDWGKT